MCLAFLGFAGDTPSSVQENSIQLIEFRLTLPSDQFSTNNPYQRNENYRVYKEKLADRKSMRKLTNETSSKMQMGLDLHSETLCIIVQFLPFTSSHRENHN